MTSQRPWQTSSFLDPQHHTVWLYHNLRYIYEYHYILHCAKLWHLQVSLLLLVAKINGSLWEASDNGYF